MFHGYQTPAQEAIGTIYNAFTGHCHTGWWDTTHYLWCQKWTWCTFNDDGCLTGLMTCG